MMSLEDEELTNDNKHNLLTDSNAIIIQKVSLPWLLSFDGILYIFARDLPERYDADFNSKQSLFQESWRYVCEWM